MRMTPEHLSFEMAPIALCLTQARKVSACNTAFVALFGYSACALKDQSIAILYPSRQEFQRTGERGYPQMTDDGKYHDERLMRRQDEQLIWCRVLGCAVNKKDPAAAAIWSFEPITQSVPKVRLSPRERELVTHLTQGLTSKQIARELQLSPRTVEDYRAKLLRKMGVRTTLQLLSKLV